MARCLAHRACCQGSPPPTGTKLGKGLTEDQCLRGAGCLHLELGSHQPWALDLSTEDTEWGTHRVRGPAGARLLFYSLKQGAGLPLHISHPHCHVRRCSSTKVIYFGSINALHVGGEDAQRWYRKEVMNSPLAGRQSSARTQAPPLRNLTTYYNISKAWFPPL